MRSCGVQCIKYLIFVFNIIFCVAGLLLIVLGAIILHQLLGYKDFVGATCHAAAIILIVVGCITFLIAAAGCYGVCSESYRMLFIFACLLILVLMLKVTACIVGYVYRNEMKQYISDSMEQSIRDLENSTASDIWESLQQQFRCCGVHNYTDWFIVHKYADQSLPLSCCETTSSPYGCTRKKEKSTDETGCAEALSDYVKSQEVVLIAIASCLAFFQATGVVLSCILAVAIRKYYKPIK